MKRDMDLIRQILLQAEATDETTLRQADFAVENYDEITVARHLELLHEAGLIEANLLSHEQTGVLKGRVMRITWSGYEFLDAARNDTVWAKAKTIAAAKGSGLSFDLFKELLLQTARTLLFPGA